MAPKKAASAAAPAPAPAAAAAAPLAVKKTVTTKRARKTPFYPADDVKRQFNRKPANKPAQLRKSITPGTVLIVLAGRFRGHRVVFLKQLRSGLLLVTGPFAINGIPLRRLNQRYVIATSTKINVSGVKLDDAKYTDKYFARPAAKTTKKSEEEFFAEKAKPAELNEARFADQKEIDAAILAEVKKTPNMREYLQNRFSLTKGVYPHELTF
eukprot:TRINITY_DN424_c0_g1_i1.p3 TRINITY_DN424_c0_g1~~TRINITY_DN424_c0_g1_i1.p3  ORF type:complete len:211 (-),score=69.37 TRINITY_DN424_c0_g1_i1:54-686(-)